MWYFTWILGTGFAAFAAIIAGIAFDFKDEKNHATCVNKCKNH